MQTDLGDLLDGELFQNFGHDKGKGLRKSGGKELESSCVPFCM